MPSFTFTDRYEFDWPVRVQVPADGKFVEQEFTARFLLIPEDELMASSDAQTREAALEEDVARAGRILLGWSGIVTEDGTPLAVSDANRRLLLRQRPIRTAVIKAYMDATVLGGLRAKN